jgi:transketolase
VGKRYKSYGWQVLEVDQGDQDIHGIAEAVEEAKEETEKPTIILVKTTIGFGSAKQGTSKVHGSPLGPEDLANVKKSFGFDPEKSFAVPQQCYDAFDAKAKGAELYSAWEKLLESYVAAFPTEGADLKRRLNGELPADWKQSLPVYKPGDKAEATRVSSGNVLNALAEKMPEIAGGCADLNPSTMTYLKCSTDFQKTSGNGRNIRFGVREHAMAAVCNGMALYGCVIPFGSTFLNFIG